MIAQTLHIFSSEIPSIYAYTRKIDFTTELTYYGSSENYFQSQITTTNLHQIVSVLI